MKRTNALQALTLIGASALLTACTGVTTTLPSGAAPAFEARAQQTVVFDPADAPNELALQVAPLLTETAGRDRVIVVSYSLSPDEATLNGILDFIRARTAPGDQIKVERDFIAHLGVAVTVLDPKATGWNWWSAQAVSNNYGRATARNLEQQAANPADLKEPRTLDTQNPQSAVGAVDRYQRGSVRPLGEVSLEAGGGKSM